MQEIVLPCKMYKANLGSVQVIGQSDLVLTRFYFAFANESQNVIALAWNYVFTRQLEWCGMTLMERRVITMFPSIVVVERPLRHPQITQLDRTHRDSRAVQNVADEGWRLVRDV